MRRKSSEKPKLKRAKGLWSPDEDQKLRNYILNHGLGCWSSVPIYAGLQRNGKSCRLRWINYLRPGLKRGTFSLQEEKIILTLHGILGNKWSQMSQHLPGRTDNEIKNHWHSYLKKKVANSQHLKAQCMPLNTENKESSSSTSSSSLKLTRIDSSLDSDEHTERSSTAINPLDSSKSFPKILFAEWLSLDLFHESKAISMDTCYCSSQETIMNGFGETQELSNSFADSTSHLQLKPEHQHEETMFCDLIFEDDIYQNFDINDVIMYSYDDLYSASTPSVSDTRFSVT